MQTNIEDKVLYTSLTFGKSPNGFYIYNILDSSQKVLEQRLLSF